MKSLVTKEITCAYGLVFNKNKFDRTFYFIENDKKAAHFVGTKGKKQYFPAKSVNAYVTITMIIT